jgi:hypothetical protein
VNIVCEVYSENCVFCEQSLQEDFAQCAGREKIRYSEIHTALASSVSEAESNIP